MSEFENAAIAIQKEGRLTEGSLQWLNENADTDFPIVEEPFDKRREMTDSFTGITVVGYSNGDTLKATACGWTDLGICGSDKYNELLAPFDKQRSTGMPGCFYYPERNPFRLKPRGEKLGFGMCRLVLARPGEIWDGPVTRLVTSYPKLARLYTQKMKMGYVTVDTAAGGVEMIGRRGGYDAVVDVVDSGDTLKKNGLVEAGTIATCEAMLVERRKQYDGANLPVSPSYFEAAELAMKLDVLEMANGGRSEMPSDIRATRTPLLAMVKGGGCGAQIYNTTRVGNH